MRKEAQEYLRKCDQCQRFAPNMHQPGGVLNPLSSPWPFTQWGLDIVSPFPKAAGNKRYLLVSMDYFSKQVEAEPLKTSRTWMPRSLFGKILSLDSGSPIPSSQTTAFSLTARPLGDIVVTRVLRIDIPPWLTHKGMDRPRLLTR